MRWRAGWLLALACAACDEASSDGGGDGGPAGDVGAAPDAGSPTADAAPDATVPAADAAPDAGAPDAVPPTGRLLDADCDPIGVHCGLPFPSDVYLEDDPARRHPSGKVVRFRPDTLPKAFRRHALPLELFEEHDGWSPSTAAMTYMPGATAQGLATPASIPTTLTPDSPTILLNATTGALVPHWVDLDESARNADQKMLMLRPAVLLEHQTRYIVAIRRVKDASGNDLAPTDVFQSIRDRIALSDDPSVSSRFSHYHGDLFPKLEAAGVERGSLQIAWDFTTASLQNVTGPMLAVRDAALAVVGEDGPEYTVQAVEPEPNEHVKTRIVLLVRCPVFLTTAAYEPGDPPPRLIFDAQGRPTQTGWMEAEVLVQVPRVADEPGRRLGVVQNGHGLFGTRYEGQNGYLARIASYGYVTAAQDLFGFAEPDIVIAAEALSARPGMVAGFVDRQIQGMVNQLLVMRMLIGRVARDGITDTAGNVLLAPGAIDPALRAYRGDSQGGIMGGTYMSISTDVTRGLLGETGTPYNLLLNRSVDWPGYGGILGSGHPNDLDVQLMLGLVQMRWDRSEPAGFVRHLARDPLPGTPTHDVLMHVAIGDHQVYTGAAHVMARAIGAKLLQSDDPAMPFVREPWGVETAAGPLQDESALVEYLFDLPPEPLTNLPLDQGCDPHDRVRVLEPSYEQQDHFFRTGEIRWFCQGICNCDVGDRPEGGCPESFESQCQ